MEGVTFQAYAAAIELGIQLEALYWRTVDDNRIDIIARVMQTLMDSWDTLQAFTEEFKTGRQGMRAKLLRSWGHEFVN